MKAATSLTSLYNIILKIAGPVEAKNAVSTATYLVLAQLQEDGLEITQENIDLKLELYVEDFIQVASKTNVA